MNRPGTSRDSSDVDEALREGLVDAEVSIATSEGLCDGLANHFERMGKKFFSKETLHQRVPITSWIRGYDAECLQGDVLAGITVGLTVIPQSIAYAVVAGVPPNFGLYSAFMGCFIYMVFGSSKDVTIGPTAIMSIITHEYTKNLACTDDESLSVMAVLLTFLMGFIIMLAASFRIGFLITFIGRTVIIGFTSAAAINIATSQVDGLLGIKTEAEGTVQTWIEIFTHISETKWEDITLGLSCCVVLLVLRQVGRMEFAKKTPIDSTSTRVWKQCLFLMSVGRNAIVVVLCCLLAYLLRESEPFSITGYITPGFPEVKLPTFTLTCNNTNSSTGEFYDFGEVAQMFGSALFIVPVIAILEDIAIASAFAGGKAIDATQEMFALGLCNFVGSFFQSIPTTGSFSRSAVNSTSGVKTQAGGAVTGTLVVLALLFLTPAFKYIPKSALSAVIICAVIFMVEYHDIIPIWKSYRLDQIPLWTTFLTCVLWKLEWGILVGTGVNIAMLLYLQATPNIQVKVDKTAMGDGTVIVRVIPSLGMMFPSAEYVKRKVSEAGVKHMPLTVVVDCSHASSMDYTAGLAMRDLMKAFSSRDQKVQFTNANEKVTHTLKALIPEIEEMTVDSLPYTVDEVNSSVILTNTEPASPPCSEVPQSSGSKTSPPDVEKDEQISSADPPKSERKESDDEEETNEPLLPKSTKAVIVPKDSSE